MIDFRETLLKACCVRMKYLPAALQVNGVAALAGIDEGKVHHAIGGGDLSAGEWQRLARVLRLDAGLLQRSIHETRGTVREYAVRGGRQ